MAETASLDCYTQTSEGKCVARFLYTSIRRNHTVMLMQRGRFEMAAWTRPTADFGNETARARWVANLLYGGEGMRQAEVGRC